YIFRTVSDRNYRNIKVNLPPILQNIHPQPSAAFVGDRTGMKTCRGSSMNLDVELYGSGPWDIEYRVIRGTDIQLFSEKNITQKTTTLTLPPFEREGIYSVVSFSLSFYYLFVLSLELAEKCNLFLPNCGIGICFQSFMVFPR